MLFALNKDSRQTFCMIGGNVFTYDNPGPKEIDLTALSTEELNQFVYSAKRGVLMVENPSEFLTYVQNRRGPAIPSTTQPIKPVTEVKDNKLDALKKLLTKSISSIKKVVPELSISEVKSLLILESEDKNRKGLTDVLLEQVKKHQEAVMAKVGTEDIAGKFFVPGERKGSPLVSDIVESDMNDVEIKFT